MATKYNDIIRKRSGRAAYSIEEEKGNQWASFIPNGQFNTVLRTVLRSVRGNDIDAHKSFWINGTYGTGKSHAVAVISHLLCDTLTNIKEWVDYEYGADKFDLIRSQIYSLRKVKRLLPVKIEGLCDMSHVSDLPLVLQTAVVKALNEVDLEIAVDTDFDALVQHIQDNQVIWDYLIDNFAELRSIASTREKLIQKLRGKDMATFQKAKSALRKANMTILLNQENVGAWLIEVQEKLRTETDYKGLLIIWDEFTDVMEDSIGIPVLKALQTIAQKFANEENDSFLFLISHPSAFNKLGNEETKQTDGRYHRMKYNMESVSAFKIMSRKFEIIDQERHQSMTNFFYSVHNNLLDLYTASSNDPKETRGDLLNLFPIHPATANLATHYATVVGSSSRSVFEFIGQNEAMEQFLESETAFANRETVTADYLWDFVLKVFQDDVLNYGAVTERFNTYRQHVEDHGKAAYAIFKGILLLNAFNNISAENNNDLVTPTEDNIINLFLGTQYESEVKEVLNWFNDQGIIQRTPGGIFSVQFTALPSHEIEELKHSLANDTDKFRFISSILNFGDTAASYFTKKIVQKIIRPYTYHFYSEASNDALLKDRIKRAKKESRPSDLYLALLFSKNNAEIAHLREFADLASNSGVTDDKDLRDIIFIVFDTAFGDKQYARFIEYMANYTSAQSHGFLDQVNVHRDHAADMIKEWLQNASRGNATVYINGQQIPISVKRLSPCLNDTVAPIIFPQGPDAIETIRSKAPNTFWKPQVSKEIIRTFIFSTSKSELTEVAGQMKPVQYLIQDAIDENLEWRVDMPENHPFKMVYDFIQNKIKYADKSLLFNFIEKFDDLRKPPYGLSGNYASAAMVAFAMRNWENKIFDTLGKPLDKNNLVEVIGELFSVWEKGKNSNKLSFKFQTPEEGKLCKSLVKTFKLDKLKGYSDISSLKDARFAITGSLLEEKGYPLWALKYMDEEFVNSHPAILLNEDIKRLFDNIVAVCGEKDIKNPALIKDTLNLIETYRADIPDIMAKPGNFQNGFNNFMLSQPGIGLQNFEVDSAYDFVKKHLESTVGYWSEEEVIVALKDWRIAENDKIEAERRREEEERHRLEREERERKLEEEHRRLEEEAKNAKNAAIQELKGNPEHIARKKVSARQYIDSIDSADVLRSLLDKVINLGYEFVIDKILESSDNQG
ncbi:hypothetical protein QVN91_07180 [Bacteroides caecigallinarum]|nr:hypothetical protein [Bacteroides caecigallinarum]